MTKQYPFLRAILFILFGILLSYIFPFVRTALFCGIAESQHTTHRASSLPLQARKTVHIEQELHLKCDQPADNLIEHPILPAMSCNEYWATAGEPGRPCGSGAPPREIPVELFDAFTLNNSTKVSKKYRNDVYAGKEALSSVWTTALIDELIEHPKYTYGRIKVIFPPVLKRFPVFNQTGLVVGSETPWMEAYLLKHGATHVSTVEYGKITNSDPRLTTYTPYEMGIEFIGKRLQPFDFVFTYSSLEHSGLGRYGDKLNPNGDLEWIQRIKCVLKPGGILYFSVPMSIDTDCVVFNAHRVYGPLRRKLAFDGSWGRPFDTYSTNQKIRLH